MPYATVRPESQASLIGSPRSSAFATAGHSSSEHSTTSTARLPFSSGPAPLVVPASPVHATAPARDDSARRPSSVASSISTTSTLAATEDVKGHSVDYDKPQLHGYPPQPFTTVRDVESGAEQPGSRRLAVLSAMALLIVTAIVVAVVLSLNPSHHGEHPPVHDVREPPGQSNPRIADI